MFYLSSHQAQQFKLMLAGIDGEQRAINAKVCSANHLARRVVYELDQMYAPDGEQQTSVEVFDDDGEIRRYFVKFIDTKHLGIVPYLLTPVDSNNNRMHLIFRGSKDSPAWCRSTEMPAPGCESFYEERFAILTAVHASLLEFNKDNIHLIISGHSLGGADAQTCASELLQLMAEQDQNNTYNEYAKLSAIKRITVNHANSAGVLYATACACMRAAEYLAQRHLVQVSVMCVLTAGDGVQQTGQSHILSDVDASVAKVELVKLRSDYEGLLDKRYMIPAMLTIPVTYVFAAAYVAYAARNAYAAHRQRFFDNADFKDRSFKIYTNATEEGRAKILAKLSKHPLDNSVAHSLVYMLHRLQVAVTHTRRHVPREQGFVMIDAQDCQEAPNGAAIQENMPQIHSRCIIS